MQINPARDVGNRTREDPRATLVTARLPGENDGGL
jgi:hypothetical protein